jgi:hypothetical protein
LQLQPQIPIDLLASFRRFDRVEWPAGQLGT